MLSLLLSTSMMESSCPDLEFLFFYFFSSSFLILCFRSSYAGLNSQYLFLYSSSLFEMFSMIFLNVGDEPKSDSEIRLRELCLSRVGGSP